jgi:hypothetical protein
MSIVEVSPSARAPIVEAVKAAMAVAPELTDEERAAAIRAHLAEVLKPALDYINAQGKLGFLIDFHCGRTSPNDLTLHRVDIAKVL